MVKNSPLQTEAWTIASHWCLAKGEGWTVTSLLGVGGTAAVFEVESPTGPRALKIYDEKFSSGELGAIEEQRIQQQMSLQGHDCPSLVEVYEGGRTSDRHYILTSRALGTELEKRLHDIPRSRIRGILHDVASACLFLKARDICHRDIKAANIFISDDFSRATLLDISVIRSIHDPLGIGTDHGGQLPVLATARYSPPEYLFRLMEPSAKLWHALNVYQLGGLLHDLITGTPLFHEEYKQCETNRYRFAWVVATQVPSIDASDVDSDLRFLAHRALDKDWNRRSKLRIEDFLNEPAIRQENALRILGLNHDPGDQIVRNVQENRLRLDEVSMDLKEHLTNYLRNLGVTATHQVSPGPTGDNSREIELNWDVADELGSTVHVTLKLTLCRIVAGVGNRFEMVAKLSMRANDEDKPVTIDLPDISDDEHSAANLASQSEEALASLATELTRA